MGLGLGLGSGVRSNEAAEQVAPRALRVGGPHVRRDAGAELCGELLVLDGDPGQQRRGAERGAGSGLRSSGLGLRLGGVPLATCVGG